MEVPAGLNSWEAVNTFLETLYPLHGEFVDVTRMDPADHTDIDPIAEIKMMRPDLPIIAI